jgi:protein-S-isoprenylcysteine O-methyltransferase Ste14
MATNETDAKTAGVVMPPPLLFLSGLVIGALAEWLMPLDPLPAIADPPRWIAGAVVVLAGLAVAAWALRLFRAAGTPVEPWHATKAIVTSGPYRFSRNPIYLAAGLVYIGLALALALWWALALLPAVWLILHFGVVRREEAYLADRFGEAYRAYCTRTRRYL